MTPSDPKSDPGGDPKAFLTALFQAAVAAASPAEAIPRHLPEPPSEASGGRTIVVGAGKAAAAMAKAVEDHWPGKLEGLVVTRYGHGLPAGEGPSRIEVVEAGHPVPDDAGEHAAARILELAQGAGEHDLLLCLISGGGSALLPLPAAGFSLEEKQAVNRALLRSGATIGEINCVRKHLSAIKGGRLAAAAFPARVVSLIISDVPGDDPAVIASGPTVPDPTSQADAVAILKKYDIHRNSRLLHLLERYGTESPKPGDAAFAKVENILIARPQRSLEAAAALAEGAGVTPLILGDSLEGESREVALVMAGIAAQVRRHGQPVRAPALLLSGGETTVTVTGEGRGGRNAEFTLAFAIAAAGWENLHVLACDTDGIDGSEDNAGAYADGNSLARGHAMGLDGKARLADNDAYGFFQGLGDLISTGPTRTNVNDFRAILVL